MSFLPFEKLHYAETHFKFKLPWSLLYKAWPEIIFDMPFQVEPGVTPKIWIVVRDADQFPVFLDKARIKLECTETQAQEVRTFDLGANAKTSLAFYPLELCELKPGHYKIYAEVDIKRTSDWKERTVKRWTLPGLKPTPIHLQILSQKLPRAPGFAVGEMHCHTNYSTDHVEFGATPNVLQEAAKAQGLDFVNCTDHAYDFAFTKEDYTKEAESPAPRFEELKDELKKLPKYPDMPMMIAGEEVSAGNSKGENVHMTVLAPEEYMPGLGDCGRYWLSNKPTRKIQAHLEAVKAPCFAAHPKQPMGALERFIFRRGYWKNEDLQLGKAHSIRGIQFWNGVRDEGFALGRTWWIEELGKGNYLLPIGGNDAHGDLNETTAVNLPLVSLKNNSDHVFARVRTAIRISNNIANKTETALTESALKESFEGDECFITDGPALWWERKEKQIVFHARSTPDIGGAFRYIRIYGRRLHINLKPYAKEEVLMESQVLARMETDISVNFENFAYVRAECETATGRFAMTSAAKLR